MRKALFKRSIGSTAACRYRQGEPRSTVSSITRHGTLSLYAALNPQTGEVMSQTATRHTTQEFVAFLEEVATQPVEREVQFTPTYSSWLNQVESWFSKLQRDVIDRGIFTSVADLKRKILCYIRLYQKTAKPFQWKYSDVRTRIPAW